MLLQFFLSLLHYKMFSLHGTRVAQSVKCLSSAQTMIPGSSNKVLQKAPCSAGSFFLCLHLLLLVHSHSLLQINKIFKKQKKVLTGLFPICEHAVIPPILKGKKISWSHISQQLDFFFPSFIYSKTPRIVYEGYFQFHYSQSLSNPLQWGFVPIAPLKRLLSRSPVTSLPNLKVNFHFLSYSNSSIWFSWLLPPQNSSFGFWYSRKKEGEGKKVFDTQGQIPQHYETQTHLCGFLGERANMLNSAPVIEFQRVTKHTSGNGIVRIAFSSLTQHSVNP